MKTPVLPSTALALLSLLAWPASSRAADNLETAIRKAYAEGKEEGKRIGRAIGYQEGLIACRNNGGTSGQVPLLTGTPAVPRGGSTSGHETQPLYRFRSDERRWTLQTNATAPAQVVSLQELVNQVTEQGETSGVVTIESVPVRDLPKLQEAIREIGKGDITLRPAKQ